MASSSASFRICRPTRRSHSADPICTQLNLVLSHFVSSFSGKDISCRLHPNGYLRLIRDVINELGPTTRARRDITAGADPHVAHLAFCAGIFRADSSIGLPVPKATPGHMAAGSSHSPPPP